MKNKYKAAGMLNVILGVVELLGILGFLGIFLILFLLEGEVVLFFLGLIVGIPLLIFCAPAVVQCVFMIITGARMISGKEGKIPLKTAIWINVGIKCMFVYSGIFSLYAEWDGSQEMLILLITAGVLLLGVPLLSMIMDIVALLKKK